MNFVHLVPRVPDKNSGRAIGLVLDCCGLDDFFAHLITPKQHFVGTRISDSGITRVQTGRD